MTVSAPFSTTIAPLWRAAPRARASLSPLHVEQPRELALMRRHDAGSADCLRELGCVRGEHDDRIGIEQHRPRGRKQGEGPMRGCRRRRRRRARSGMRCSANRCEQARQIAVLVSGCTMMLVRARGVQRECDLRHGDGREAGAHARRRARRHARRAGHGIAAAQQRMAARVLVARSVRTRQRRPPQRRIILPGVDGEGFEDVRRECRCPPRRSRRTGRGPAAAHVRASCARR